jgi:hypothetical protein
MPDWMSAPGVFFWMHAGKKARRPGVIASPVAEGVAVIRGEAGQYEHVLPERFKRL